MTNHISILADSLTGTKDRAEKYGDPKPFFDRASAIASLILGTPVTSYEISVIQHAMVLARMHANRDALGFYTDAISYMALAADYATVDQNMPKTPASPPARPAPPPLDPGRFQRMTDLGGTSIGPGGKPLG